MCCPKMSHDDDILREVRGLDEVADGERDVTLDGVPHDSVGGLDINVLAMEKGQEKSGVLAELTSLTVWM